MSLFRAAGYGGYHVAATWSWDDMDGAASALLEQGPFSVDEADQPAGSNQTTEPRQQLHALFDDGDRSTELTDEGWLLHVTAAAAVALG
jgi:hypothetical protein